MKVLGSLPPPATTVVPRDGHRVSAGTLPLASKQEGVSYSPCQVHRLLWAAEFMECGQVLQDLPQSPHPEGWTGWCMPIILGLRGGQRQENHEFEKCVGLKPAQLYTKALPQIIRR